MRWLYDGFRLCGWLRFRYRLWFRSRRWLYE
jgi:hypothetical protein